MDVRSTARTPWNKSERNNDCEANLDGNYDDDNDDFNDEHDESDDGHDDGRDKHANMVAQRNDQPTAVNAAADALGELALFGELALIYETARAATVVAATAGVRLWTLDREPFKMLLAQSCQEHYTKYEGWLSQVDILKTLNHYELARISECLEQTLHDEGEAIVRVNVLDVNDNVPEFLSPETMAAVPTTAEYGQHIVKLEVGYASYHTYCTRNTK